MGKNGDEWTGRVDSRLTYFILRAYTGPVLATANIGKTQERFWEKMVMNGPEGWKLARKKPLAVSVACMAAY